MCCELYIHDDKVAVFVAQNATGGGFENASTVHKRVESLLEACYANLGLEFDNSDLWDRIKTVYVRPISLESFETAMVAVPYGGS